MCELHGHDLIIRATKEDKVIEQFIKAQLQLLNDEWENTSNQTIKKALKAYSQESNQEKGIEKFLAALLVGLKTVVKKTKLKEFKVLVQGLYDTFKTNAAKKFKTDLIFEKIDKGLIKVFSTDGPYWINNFYETFLSDRISELSKKLLEKI